MFETVNSAVFVLSFNLVPFYVSTPLCGSIHSHAHYHALKSFICQNLEQYES